MKLIVGIDFGTSTTVVRYKKDAGDNIYSVKDADGVHDTIPSAIFRIAGQNQTLYGHEALNARAANLDGELITNFKMGLLDADEDDQILIQSYIEEFLRYVYQRFALETQGLQYDEMDVLISYPAKWPPRFVNIMKNVVRKAGFNGYVYGIKEPTAATFNMLHKHVSEFQRSMMLTPNTPMHVFMLDMGAGTTDIVIFRLNIDAEGNIDSDHLMPYPSIDNPCLCGGREIDVALLEHIKTYVCNNTKMSSEEFDDNEVFTLENAKFWKDTILSRHLKNGQIVPIPIAVQNAFRRGTPEREAISSYNFSKTNFENVTESHWKNLYYLITSAIEKYHHDYQIGAEDIDLLFLTGGHSQWYTVQNLFNGEGVCGYIGKDYQKGQTHITALDFKKLKADPSRMFSDALPHECVAIGLCLQDQKIKWTEVASNNVWVRFEMNNTISEPVQVVRMSDSLPTSENVNINLGLIKSDWQKDQKNDFRGYFYIYSGNSFDTAIRHKVFVEKNLGWVWLLPGNQYFVKADGTVMMSKEGLLEIAGTVTIEKDNIFASPDYIHFSEKDLKEE